MKWVKKFKLVSVILAVVILGACSSSEKENRELQSKYDNLAIENEELKSKVKELTSERFTIKEVLDMASSITSCEPYCEDIENHDSLLIASTRDNLYLLNKNIDETLPGVYHSDEHILILYPNGKYLRVWDNRKYESFSVMEGQYTAKSGKLSMIDTIASAGSDSWENYELTNTGIVISSYKPGSTTPTKITFNRLHK